MYSLNLAKNRPSRSNIVSKRDNETTMDIRLKFIIPTMGILLLSIGCGDLPSSNYSNATNPSNPPNSKIKSASAQELNEDVSLTLQIIKLKDKTVRLTGTTNLPTGTKLMLQITEKAESGFLGQSSCIVLPSGNFGSDKFGPDGGLQAGHYTASVTMPIARLQPETVKNIIGSEGENLTGPLAIKGDLGITVSTEMVFTIGSEFDANKKAEIANEEVNALKQKLSKLLDELIQFKDKPDFKQYGFGIGGPYNKWLTTVENLKKSHQTKTNLPILLKSAPLELIMLGKVYMREDESNFTQKRLSELKSIVNLDSQQEN